jgi:hypothetical protein
VCGTPAIPSGKLGGGFHFAGSMSTSKIRYRCEGFSPIDAANITHAAQLFAVRIARRKYGPKGRCSRLSLHHELEADGAIFETFLGISKGIAMTGETYRFSVFVDDRKG